MQVCQVEVDFAFPFGEGCTPDRLRLQLSSLAEYWPGWHQFPWRVTRKLHHWLRREEVNFSYLMIQRCVTGYAAHLVLTAPFQDREAVLRVMIAMRFEVAGLMRDLLLEAVRGEMLRTRKPYILDCSGPEDWHEHVEPEEIAQRREAFQRAFEGAALQFRTILNVAGMTNGKPGTMTLGRKIETWAHGVEMPDLELLEVRVEDRGRYRILMPCEEEADAIASAGKPVPRLIEGDLRAAREELRCLAGSGGASGQVAVGGVPGAGKKKTRRRGGQETGDGGVGGCGAELVMRARGMTVVAMPGDGDVESCMAKALKSAGGGQLAVGSGRLDDNGAPLPSAPGAGEGAAGTAGTGAAGAAEKPRGEPPAMEGHGASERLREKRANAGRKNAVVKDRGDRNKIRAEVKRIIELGLTKSEACCQVSDQMREGRVGEKPLTMKYVLPGFAATPAVVARLFRAKW